MIRWLKSKLPVTKAQRLALAEAEMLNGIWVLHRQQEQMGKKLDEIIEALNAFGFIVGLEWNQTDKRWLKLQ